MKRKCKDQCRWVQLSFLRRRVYCTTCRKWMRQMKVSVSKDGVYTISYEGGEVNK